MKGKKTVVITRGFVGLAQGFYFDYGDRSDFAPLGGQHNAFKTILSLIDKGCDVQLKNCTLSGIYQDIQAVQQHSIHEMEEKIEALKLSLGTDSK